MSTHRVMCIVVNIVMCSCAIGDTSHSVDVYGIGDSIPPSI